MAQPKGRTPSAGRVGEFGALLEYLVPGSATNRSHLRWPPDVFAICAYVLKLTGAYVDVLREWPPHGALQVHPAKETWDDWIEREARAWRAVATNSRKLPVGVLKLWSTVAAASGKRISQIAKERAVVSALLQLVAMADEASAGVGIPQRTSKDKFRDRALTLLAGSASNEGSSLSPSVSSATLRVLPKQHSPRGGLTLRSLTHHLALHVGGEVTPFWYTVPQSGTNQSLNLLVAPWPLAVQPRQFRPVAGKHYEMPERFGLVEFTLAEDPERVAAWTSSLIAAATKVSGRVDGVVFPEAALSENEYEAVLAVVREQGAFLIAGVLRDEEGGAPSNLVMFDALTANTPVHIEQRKHHRWRLDRGQIEMYGLGGTLDPGREWWEHIALEKREVHFIALNEELSLCCLVCEDLARQDPVAELVRSVGPNLVVALLMDAPQLGARWPARYATVLADDPGSSVLTVTSAGMVDLTRPPRSAKPSRSVGLWKDAKSDFVELELPVGAAGLLLNLCTEVVEEWTADGRSDDRVTGYPRLGGVHPVRVTEVTPALSSTKSRKPRRSAANVGRKRKPRRG